jgi:hypothetical protein
MVGLDSGRQEQAKGYARIVRRLWLFEFGIAAFYILVLLLTPLSTGLGNLLDLPPRICMRRCLYARRSYFSMTTPSILGG